MFRGSGCEEASLHVLEQLWRIIDARLGSLNAWPLQRRRRVCHAKGEGASRSVKPYSSSFLASLRDANMCDTRSHGKNRVSATAEKGRSMPLSTGCSASLGCVTL